MKTTRHNLEQPREGDGKYPEKGAYVAERARGYNDRKNKASDGPDWEP